jgi:hypothetical protein
MIICDLLVEYRMHSNSDAMLEKISAASPLDEGSHISVRTIAHETGKQICFDEGDGAKPEVFLDGAS